MARKPSSEWTEAYRRRIEKALAQGKTRQQARGHKAGEHVTRAVAKGLPPPKSRTPRLPPAPPPETHADKLKRLARERQAERDRRAREGGMPTKNDMAFATSYAKSIAKYFDDVDAAQLAIEARSHMQAIGPDRFRREAGKQREMRHRFVYGPYDANVGLVPLVVLQFWSASGGLPEDRWYFYH